MIDNINYDINDIAGEGPTEGTYARFNFQKESDTTVRFLPTPRDKPTFVIFSRHWIDNKPILSPADGENLDPMSVVGKWAEKYARKIGKDHEDFPAFAGYPHRNGLASLCRAQTLVAYNLIVRPALPDGESSQHYTFLPYSAHMKFWTEQRKRASLWAARGRECNPFHPEQGLDLQIGYHPDSVKDKRDTWSVTLDTDPMPIGVDGWDTKLFDLEEEVYSQTTWSNEELIAFCKNKFDALLSSKADTSVEEILAAAGWEFK